MQWLNSAGWRFHRSQPRFAAAPIDPQALAIALAAHG